jgi:hypothetical protein
MDSRERPPRDHVGLCASCAHASAITSSRGSVFYLCRLSLTDPSFAKYPRLPVRACVGFTAAPSQPAARDPSE